MLKAVLFDMDGVIVDTEPLHREAYFSMFDELRIDVSSERYEAFTGQATLPICKTLCQEFDLPNEPEELVRIKRRHFKEMFDTSKNLKLINGVEALIKDYYQYGLTMVLASSASMFTIDKVFNRFGLNQYFKAKLSGADLKASKPHPEIFEKAAEISGFSKSECIVIEDSTNGIRAAKSAGIYCVAFKSPHSKNQQYNQADLIIKDFREISTEQLNGSLLTS